VEFAYESSSRAIAVLNFRPARVELDGVEAKADAMVSGGRFVLMLPRGQHLVSCTGVTH
jgi:hypothetical protein